MSALSFEQTLIQANSAAQCGDWAAAIAALCQAQQAAPDDSSILTALGTCHIQNGEVRTALGYFEQAAALSPDSFEAQNNLGVAYTLAGEYGGAERAYRSALQIDGDNLAAWKNLAQTCLQQDERASEGVQIVASLVQAHPADDGVLVMMGNIYEEGGELVSAETLFQQALTLNSANPDAADGLQRIQAARARQAHIARPEHAKKLAALKGLKAAHKMTQQELPQEGPFGPEVKQVALYALEDTQAHLQARLLARRLSASGRSARVAAQYDAADRPSCDLLVFAQPILSRDYVKGIESCIRSGQPFAIVIDQDLHHLPVDHPAYAQVGPGNPGALKVFETMLSAARFVMASTPALAECYMPYCQKIVVMPPEIDLENPLWKKPRQPHDGFRVGWIGSAADRPDLLSIKKALLAFVRATPQAVLVFAGDEGALVKFAAIDESRRLFLPAAGPDEIPYLLGQFDVLIHPLRDNPFNQAKSALPLMEAAARGIPWVASNLPAFAGCPGGMLANTAAEWEKLLRQIEQGKNEV